MLAVVPTFDAVGVPPRDPVLVLNAAQEGLCAMENCSVRWRGSVVVGVKEYACPTVTLVAGDPEIVGRSRYTVAADAVSLYVVAATAKIKATTNVKRCDLRAGKSTLRMLCKPPGNVLITSKRPRFARE